MVKNKIFGVFGAGLFAVLSGVMASSGAGAWGPERTLFTNESPATYPVFNSITDNAALGDERDFVRIVEVGTGKVFTNEVDVRGGHEYQVYIYYHNNASSTFNTKEYNYSGVARETKMATQFPLRIEKGQKGVVSATISAVNTNPAKVWDEAYMTATETVELAYKVGSAKIFNDWGASGSVLSTNLFSSGGTYIGLDNLNGVILGCAEYSGEVIYTIVATAVPDPEPTPTPTPTPTGPDDPEPTPTPTPTDPDDPGSVTEDPTPEDQPKAPQELPQTGPAEIALAVVIILGLSIWGIYYFYSKKKLEKVKSSVLGGDSDDENISQDE